ncbi:ciliary-associated calcium-binding coiled-coil protein 1-like isoform X2 [Anneissia japonica]|uniref:ciliary-associated calcium-binding coiled-coil protein 1-like isoform X2 n=1 Tax=Anneissia japonica TaxID=1529436 RepID=UPI0014256303|nr:ciliary-associated calcium-binding coiled-coil protein 1-like isoform X2 [Anneissia japonica]
MVDLSNRIMASTTKGKKSKTSHATVQIIGKGQDAYKDINWNTLSDDEARNIEKEGSLAWKILSNTQTLALQQMSVEDVEKTLGEILGLSNTATELQGTILLDCYTVGFWWAKEEGFTSQQLSAFITLLNRLINNIKDKKYSLSDNILDLKTMMTGIGNDSTEDSGGMDFLDVEQAIKITDYLKTSLFQHHRMYEFMFHSERKEEIIGTEICIETLPPANVPFPAPLDEGIPEEIYKQCIAPPVPCQEEDIEEMTDKPDEEQVNDPEKQIEDGIKVEVEVNPLKDVTAADVKKMFDIVSTEMFESLQLDVSRKLRERESEIITRINKIHRVAEA